MPHRRPVLLLHPGGKKVHLLRHAKSDWADEGLDDHDRPLAPRGRKPGGRLREHLENHPLKLDLVLSSTARRAREKLSLLSPDTGAAAVPFEEQRYEAGPDELPVSLP